MAALAHNRTQHEIHPLLRHPRPIKRDSAKAQQMLGLIAESEGHLRPLQREKSVTTRWLERPLYEHLDLLDMTSEKEETDCEARSNGRNDEAKPVENMDMACGLIQTSLTHLEITSSAETRIMSSAQSRPVSIACPLPNTDNAQHFLAPEQCASPDTMRLDKSPDGPHSRLIQMQPGSPQIEKSQLALNADVDFSLRTAHSQSWGPTTVQHEISMRTERAMSCQPQNYASISVPVINEPYQRQRPCSSVAYAQARNRSNSKITSSRGMRNNNYPSLSRPASAIVPKVIPGEQMEKEVLCSWSSDKADESICTHSWSDPSPHDVEQNGMDKSKARRKSRNRWSAIPDTLKKLTKRRSCTVTDSVCSEGNTETLRWTILTKDIHVQDGEGGKSPLLNSAASPALLPTPANSPVGTKHSIFASSLPLPFAPWTHGPPSPATCTDKNRSSLVFPPMSIKRSASSQLSVEIQAQVRPASWYSSQGSHFSPLTCSPDAITPTRGTPALKRTCIRCKMPKSAADFSGYITANCWHESATCAECVQVWVESFAGSSWCPCPECGEKMTSKSDDDGGLIDAANSAC